jgi:hypothetical protein
MYGQHLNRQQPAEVQPNEEPAPSSSGYGIPDPHSEPGSRENPSGPVPRWDSKHRYLIQEARLSLRELSTDTPLGA